MSSCARTAAPQRYRVIWLTVSKICQSDFRRLTASTLASARPMYPTQRRPHSQLSEGLGKGRALTNSRTRGGKSFHAPQGEAREKNRNRAKAPVRKLHNHQHRHSHCKHSKSSPKENPATIPIKKTAAMRRKDTRRNDRKRGKMHCLASVHDGA